MNKLLQTGLAVSIFWISLLSSVSAQDNDSLTTHYISASEAQEDFRIMYDLIITYHPDPFKFTNASDLELSKNEFLAELTDSISESELHIIVRQYLRQIRCGHTVALPSQKWYADHVKHANFLPLRVLIQNEKIHVDTCIGARPPVVRGSEIISINGIPADKILADMRAIQPQDGAADKFVNHQIEKNFSTYFVFLYGWKNEYSIVFKIDDETEIVQIIPGIKSGSAKVDETRKAPSYLSNTDTAASMNGAVLYRFNDRQDLFYLDITTFANSGYKKFYKKVFDILKDRQDASLIIDIRDNGGGYFPNTNNLLQYVSDSSIHFTFQRPRTKPEKNPNIKMGFFSRMTKSAFSLLKDPYKLDSVRTYRIVYKPKRRKQFTGPVYLLTNGGSFSMSGYLAAFLKDQNRAILVGEETGGSASDSNGLLFNQVILPYSAIRIILPYFHRTNNTEETGGVKPDHLITYSLEERLQGSDKEYQKVLELISYGASGKEL